MNLPPLLVSVGLGVAGLGFGCAYFAALRHSVDRYASGGGPLVIGILALARIAAAVVFFGFAATLGALPALSALVGFLAARMHALRTARGAA
jgi:hypothetical protein